MIERRAFNPVDMILQFRRVVDYLSKLPATLNAAQVARYVAAEAMMSILEVDMIVVFLSEPNAPHLVKKYTIRSEKGELFDLNDLRSSSSASSHSLAANTTTTNNATGTNGNNSVGGNNTMVGSSNTYTATCMYSEMMACKPFPRSIKTSKILQSANASGVGNGGAGTGMSAGAGAATTTSVNSATVFNHTVDGTPGVVAHNAMMVPLKGTRTHDPPR